MKFSVVNLGCKVNRVEADAITAMYLNDGHELASPDDCDLIVVNTCTVTGEADKKARKAVRRALGANDRARVVVTGCGVEIAPDDFSRLGDRVDVVTRAEFEGERAHRADEGRLLRVGDAFRTRVNLKIQDGCDHRCSYCIVSTARGASRSMDADGVVAQAAAYAKYGVKELVLTGINLACYRSGEVGLAKLLERMLVATDEACPNGEAPLRMRISSVEPLDLDEDVIGVMADSDGRVCRHLHLALQSGSSRVLKEMNRPYSAEEYVALVERMRADIPSLALTTDIIVGFPGETEADFDRSIEVAKACGFSKIHVFPYSMRAGTPAAARPDQIAPEIKQERAKRLRDLSAELATLDFERRRGTFEQAIVGPDSALTESYHAVPAPVGAPLGSLVSVCLDERVGAASHDTIDA